MGERERESRGRRRKSHTRPKACVIINEPVLNLGLLKVPAYSQHQLPVLSSTYIKEQHSAVAVVVVVLVLVSSSSSSMRVTLPVYVALSCLCKRTNIGARWCKCGCVCGCVCVSVSLCMRGKRKSETGRYNEEKPALCDVCFAKLVEPKTGTRK